jgi:hypothetical protein
MNRYIQIPADIQMKNPDGSDTGVTQTFCGWLRDVILVDDKVGLSAKTLFMAGDLRMRFEDVQVGDIIELIVEKNKDEWAFLKGIVEEPTKGYNPAGALQILDYLRVVIDAPTRKPEELKRLAS